MKIEEYVKMENDLREALKHSQQKYLVIGSLLMALNHKEYYSTVENIPKGRFCKNIYELAQVRFNLCKTSVKNLIGVRKRFGLFDDEIYPDYKKYMQKLGKRAILMYMRSKNSSSLGRSKNKMANWFKMKVENR